VEGNAHLIAAKLLRLIGSDCNAHERDNLWKPRERGLPGVLFWGGQHIYLKV
jgi:hypothetical protein